MIDRERLIRKGAAYGLDLTGTAARFDRYAELLVETNEKINLTAITDPEGIEDRHFIDSLVLASQPEIGERGSLADVGSGAGFPGVVAGILKPALRLTLIEPTGKRLAFLEMLCGELGVRAEFAKERAEEAARKKWREQFDAVTARAVARMDLLCEYCLPLVKPGGVFIAMKTGTAAGETEQAAGAIAKLGGGKAELRAYSLPGGDQRCLVVIRKVKPTPPVYPRNGGVIAKRPLH